MIVISVVNNKGGVGKSTVACSLAQALALMDQNVLCVDLDNQRNLTTMLGIRTAPENTVRDLLKLSDFSNKETLNTTIADCVLQSSIENLNCISATDTLCDDDVGEEKVLATAFRKSFVAEHYDFVVIDNHPGISKLQRVSLHAADFVLVPTELQQLAVNGLSVMMRYLTKVFKFPEDHVRIVFNKYRGTIPQEAHFQTVHNLFPKSATKHAIPMDSTFDEIITENKILFLDRLLSSKAVPYIVGLMTELFPMKQRAIDANIRELRDRHLADNARIRAMKTTKKDANTH